MGVKKDWIGLKRETGKGGERKIKHKLLSLSLGLII